MAKKLSLRFKDTPEDQALARVIVDALRDNYNAQDATIRALVEEVTAYRRGGGAPELSVRLPEQSWEVHDE